MISRRTVTVLALAFSVAAALPTLANVRYTPAALAEAQKAGKSILVEVSAPWCPTCRAQKAVLSELDKQARFKNFVKIEVDFDSQKDALKTFNATIQSTLIVYKGDKEVGRLVGDSKRESIEALMAKGL